MKSGPTLTSIFLPSVGHPPIAPGVGLITLILEVVREVSWPANTEFFSIRAGEKFRSEVLLTLLTYSYATGNYGSREVESVAANDPLLRYLCGTPVPDWKTIRRFRRVHREILRQCILSVLHGSMRIRFGDGDNDAIADHCVAVALDRWFEPLCVPFPDQEAGERIERAVFVDELVSD